MGEGIKGGGGGRGRNSKFEMRPAVAGSRMCGRFLIGEEMANAKPRQEGGAGPDAGPDSGRGRDADAPLGEGIEWLKPPMFQSADRDGQPYQWTVLIPQLRPRRLARRCRHQDRLRSQLHPPLLPAAPAPHPRPDQRRYPRAGAGDRRPAPRNHERSHGMTPFCPQTTIWSGFQPISQSGEYMDANCAPCILSLRYE